MKHILKKSRFLCVVMAFFYTISYSFYNIKIMQERVEDFSFDIVNKIIYQKEVSLNPNIILFTFDELYLKKYNLLNENNESSYGYLFPRDHIATFIENLDNFTKDINRSNRPKALFIDFDVKYSMLPYNKGLSAQDKKLIEVLKNKREYIIFFPKNSQYNFIQTIKDEQIQKQIKSGKIRFASTLFKISDDCSIRRYVPKKEINNTIYENVNIALWRTITNRKEPIKEDIIGNKILFKGYKPSMKDNDCLFAQSYWSNLTKYSANCNFYEIIESDFANSIIMLGGEYSKKDYFNIINTFSEYLDTPSVSGIDIHANILNTLLYFNGEIKRLPLLETIIIGVGVFCITFFIVLLTLKKIKSYNKKLGVVVVISSIFMLLISMWLLEYKHLWFNWGVGVAFYGVLTPLSLVFIKVFYNIKQAIQRLKNEKTTS